MATRDGKWRNQMRLVAYNGCCRRVSQIRALGPVLWNLLISEDLVTTLTDIESPLVTLNTIKFKEVPFTFKKK